MRQGLIGLMFATAIACFGTACVQSDRSAAQDAPLLEIAQTTISPPRSAPPTTRPRTKNPPRLVIVGEGGASIQAALTGSCWNDECWAYDIGAPPPLQSNTSVSFSFDLDDWQFEVVPSGSCVPGDFAVSQANDQTWELVFDGSAGVRTFELKGHGPEGMLTYVFAVESTLDIGGSVPQGGFRGFYTAAETPASPELLLRLASLDPGLLELSTIQVSVMGSDGRSEAVVVQDVRSRGDCSITYAVAGWTAADLIESIGIGDWSYHFVLETTDGRWFEATTKPCESIESTHDLLTKLNFRTIDPPEIP